MIIFMRKFRNRIPKYLGIKYQWTHLPHGFPSFQADGLQAIIQRMPDAPTHYAVVKSGFDLGAVEWVKI